METGSREDSAEEDQTLASRLRLSGPGDRWNLDLSIDSGDLGRKVLLKIVGGGRILPRFARNIVRKKGDEYSVCEKSSSS